MVNRVIFSIFFILFLAVDAIVLFGMKRFHRAKVANLCFFLAVFLSYLAQLSRVYFTKPVAMWDIRTAMPIANVSPFTFTIMPLYLLLPKRLREYLLTYIALLCMGMFFAPTINLIQYLALNTYFHPVLLLDLFTHYALFLWGIYIVRSGQVRLDLKRCLGGGGFIVAVALILLVVNAICDTAYFGLNLNGKHNIYGIILSENSYVSAGLYFFGLVGVLFMGYLVQAVLVRQHKIDIVDADEFVIAPAAPKPAKETVTPATPQYAPKDGTTDTPRE